MIGFMRILGWAVLLAAISGCSGADTIWCCADEDNDLVTVLKDNGYRIVLSDDVQTTLEKAPEGAAVLLLNRLPYCFSTVAILTLSDCFRVSRFRK